MSVVSRLLIWLRGDTLVIPSWTPARVKAAEKETLRMLGRGETAYTWSKRFPKRRADVLRIERKKSA